MRKRALVVMLVVSLLAVVGVTWRRAVEPARLLVAPPLADVTSQLPPRIHRIQAKAVYAVCGGTCLAFAWYAADLAIGAWQRNEMDERALGVPSWILYAPAALSFVLMSIEFARYLFGRDTLYTGRIGGQDASI